MPPIIVLGELECCAAKEMICLISLKIILLPPVQTAKKSVSSRIFCKISSVVPLLWLRFKTSTARPLCIIADTIKCKGVSFAEGEFSTHHCHWENDKIDKAINDIKLEKSEELKKVG